MKVTRSETKTIIANFSKDPDAYDMKKNIKQEMLKKDVFSDEKKN